MLIYLRIFIVTYKFQPWIKLLFLVKRVKNIYMRYNNKSYKKDICFFFYMY